MTPRTDTDVAGDVDRGRRRPRRPRGGARPARRGRRRCASETGTSRPSAASTIAAEGDVVPVEVGREPDQPVAAPHQAGHADADADQRRGGRAPRRRPRGSGRPPSAPTCQASLAGAWRSRARCSTAPPSPTRATTTRSTPRSTAMTNGPSGAIRTRPTAGRRPRHGADRLGVRRRPERLQLGDQAGDRAAVEPHRAGQLGPRASARRGARAAAGCRGCAAGRPPGSCPSPDRGVRTHVGLDAGGRAPAPRDRVDARGEQQHATGDQEDDRSSPG